MGNASSAAAVGRLAARIGPGVRSLGCRAAFADGETVDLAAGVVDAADAADGGATLAGVVGGVRARWRFAPDRGGFWVTLAVADEAGRACTRLDSLVVTFDAGHDLAGWRVPTIGLHVEDAGLLHPGDLSERSGRGTLLRGIFPDARSPGLFVGTRLPQRCRHRYDIRATDSTTVELTCSTSPIGDLARGPEVCSEATWISARHPLREAIRRYADHLPYRQDAKRPPVGWNSWDYYYSAVAAADVVENMEAIARDPALAAGVEYVVVDMGWNHDWGEWYPNHRFPGGTAALAEQIAARGFVPGIWTAPVQVEPLTVAGLRGDEMFVPNEHGDPQRTAEGNFMVDPTHPRGRAFLTELYRRLHGEGYRFFKVDFVDCLVEAERFHDPGKGPYDALRDLFALIRGCVGAESHVLGCSLPPECGPWVADSGRTGIDIHTQWSHVEWAVDSLELSYWMHRRLWTNDADFLVVRGGATSAEERTTVRNPNANHPDPPRWRRGPTFANIAEAQTWADVVALSGGSVFLSDRIGALNEAGLALLRPRLDPTDVAAEPLDLGDGTRASRWLQELPDGYRLTLINWSDAPARASFAFGDYGLAPPSIPRDGWTGAAVPVAGGVAEVALPPRGSAVLAWEKDAP